MDESSTGLGDDWSGWADVNDFIGPLVSAVGYRPAPADVARVRTLRELGWLVANEARTKKE